MKPSKRGRLRTFISLPPFPDTEWPEAPTNTLSLGQGLLWGAGSFLDQKEPGFPALQPHTRDGSLRVVDRTVEPFLSLAEPSPAAFWWFRCPPGSVLEPYPLPHQRLSACQQPLSA